MQILKSINPDDCPASSVALGFFDGIHLGHSAVISKAVKAAQTANGELKSVVYTFAESPKARLTGNVPDSLVLLEEKSRIIASLGVDYLYTVDFNFVRELSYKEFVSKILYKSLNAKQVFCGFNYRFGLNGEGDSQALIAECKKYGISVTVVEPVMVNGEVVSSTKIRQLLKCGDVELANEMLGRKFSYRGEIIHGRRLGRKLGTPTINQKYSDLLIVPKFGVYASEVFINGTIYRGVTNIGCKPTVGSNCILSETWLTDYSGDSLYGEEARVELMSFLRPEQKFNSIEDLRAAILADGEKAKKIK